VCVVPEGAEDKVYLVVRRSINGSVKRYIERMATRTFSDETRAIFMDASVSYDGQNTGIATMSVTGGVNWDELETSTSSLRPDCSPQATLAIRSSLPQLTVPSTNSSSRAIRTRCS
jgi:hypothetical protein